MSSSDVKKVYEIRDGAEVLGQFSIKSKAMAFKKECSAEGRKVKVFVRFIKDSDRKPEPKPIPKRAVPKEKPKKVPKKVVKTVPKDVPKPAPKRAVPKETPKEVPKPTPKNVPEKPKAVPKPKVSEPTPVYSEATVSGRTLKSIAKLFKMLDIFDVPIHSQSFYLVDSIHAVMFGITNPNGRSLFGLDGNGPAEIGVDLQDIAGKCSAASVYKVRDESIRLVLDDGINPINTGIVNNVHIASRPNISMMASYVVDPVSFDAELRRVKGIIGGGKSSANPSIRLYGKDGDLMMTAKNEGYGFRADVGDGDETKGSLYGYQYLKALAEMFLMSESVCTMTMDEFYPLEAKCTVGGLQLTMLVAPMMEEDDLS